MNKDDVERLRANLGYLMLNARSILISLDKLEQQQELERLVPRYDTDKLRQRSEAGQTEFGLDSYICAICHQKFKTFAEFKDHNKCVPQNKDQRVVSRELLENIAAVMRKTYDMSTICNTKEFAEVLVQLNKTLQTEKPVLRAP